MTKRQYRFNSNPTQPAGRAFDAGVLASDTVDLPEAATLYFNTAGTIIVLPYSNLDAVPITYIVTAAQILPVRVRRIFATGTTAGLKVAMNTIGHP